MFSWTNYFQNYAFLHQVFIKKMNDYLCDDQSTVNLKECLLINHQFHYLFKNEGHLIQPIPSQPYDCICWMSTRIYDDLVEDEEGYSLTFYHRFGIQSKKDLDDYDIVLDTENISKLIHQGGSRQFRFWMTDQEYLVDSTKCNDYLTYYQIDVNPIDHRQKFLISFYMCELVTDYGRPRIHQDQHFSHWVWDAIDHRLKLADQSYVKYYQRLSSQDEPYQYDYGGHNRSKLGRTPNSLDWLDLVASRSTKIDQSFSFSGKTFQEIEDIIEWMIYKHD